MRWVGGGGRGGCHVVNDLLSQSDSLRASRLAVRAGTGRAVQSQEQREQGAEIASEEVKRQDCVCSARTQHGFQASQRSSRR